MAEPQTVLQSGVPGTGHDLSGGRRVLDIEGDLDRRIHLDEEVGEFGDVRREVPPCDLADGPTTKSTSDQTVVVENGTAIGGDPGITLDPGGAQSQCQPEGVEGVVRGERPSPPMGESDRGSFGGEPGHRASMAHSATGPVHRSP